MDSLLPKASSSEKDITTKLDLLILNEILPSNEATGPPMLMDEWLLLERILIYVEYSNILHNRPASSTTIVACLTPCKPSHGVCFYLCRSFFSKFSGIVGLFA